MGTDCLMDMEVWGVDENVLELVMTVVQRSECTKSQGTVPFKNG